MLLDRTFHPDEANQAFTAGRLLETGHYTYKPTDHHGPTLYYAAAPLQHVFGHATTATLDGTLLRCTPLLFAVLGLAFLYHTVFKLLRFAGDRPPKSGDRPQNSGDRPQNSGDRPLKSGLLALLPVLLLGTSPFFVFFATDFIQEMLLVSFTLMMLWAGVGYRVSLTPQHGRLKPGSWALLFGIAAGLAFATKETSVLTFAAATLALLIPLTLKKLKFSLLGARTSRSAEQTSSPHLGARTSRSAEQSSHPIAYRTHLAFTLIAFALTSVILFSSFCQDWQGVYNAFVAAPLSYFHRAAGDVASEGAAWHVHPWYQHLQWLFLGRLPFSFSFSNILPLATLAFFIVPVVALRRTRATCPRPLLHLFLFLAGVTTCLTILYSVLPYKTPWCTLQLLVPLLVTTALGLLLVGGTPSPVPHTLRLLSILIACVIMGVEHMPGLLALNREPDSQKIPYNYAHASPEAQQLAACVEAALSASTAPSNPFIAVALPPADTWPFPWYNRAHEHQTGYWTKFEDLVELEKTGAKPTVVIVPMTEGHLVQPLFPHLKHTRRFFMRPGVRVRVFW